MIHFKLSFLAGMMMALGARSITSEAQTSNIHDSSYPAEAIKLGLLIPEHEALAAKDGAELAIREANNEGGYEGRPFNLITHSTEGPWGTGSTVSVSMVFDDDVVAIIGSLDGRNAHLVEQVATKTRVAFLSSWETDMSLSYAFVPWYFRCIPDDHQQAIALIQEIYRKRKITNVAIIGTEDYDSRVAVQSFVKTADSMKIPPPRQFLSESSGLDFEKVLQEIDQSGIEAVILFGKPSLASYILPGLKQQNKNLAIFGSLSIIDDQKASSPDWNLYEGMTLISSGYWFTEKGIAFQKRFLEAYGYYPGPAAAYAYDGINLIIDVIKKSGADRNKIIDSFAGTDYKEGITGEIRFDEHGNRIGLPGLMTIKNGHPQMVTGDK